MFQNFKYLKGYFSTPYKYIYIEIAGTYQVSPFHVYKLAHGCEARTLKDQKILSELQKEGIIRKI